MSKTHKDLKKLRQQTASLLLLLEHPAELQLEWNIEVATVWQSIAEGWLAQTKELITDIAEHQIRL